MDWQCMPTYLSTHSLINSLTHLDEQRAHGRVDEVVADARVERRVGLAEELAGHVEGAWEG